MTNQTVFTLVNKQNGNLAFKLFSFEDNSYLFNNPASFNPKQLPYMPAKLKLAFKSLGFLVVAFSSPLMQWHKLPV